ncbi:hypothetical protein NM208_g13197 [Fusarium decemcellulare]|uniref:Uncharacterized protein n=1 Tax=Fusarium decemcellulare TaxID=57161 RepID=A0ACC1RPA2_9HYPO|nr:hypothetical protein NM208_g13197 [Fusarium decemcellulare]
MLRQLGKSRHLTKVDPVLRKSILETWYGGNLDPETDYESLFELMQGLPLALAQAGSYLRETGMGVATYTRIYNQQWQILMSSDDNPLTGYQGSIVTTWTISLKEIERQSSDSINLLRLWAFLDNKQFWRGIFLAATKPFVSQFSLAHLAAGHGPDEHNYWVLEKRLLPYAERCSQWMRRHTFKLNESMTDARIMIYSIRQLGMLFYEQRMLVMAKETYHRALQAHENFPDDDEEMLWTVFVLGYLFRQQAMPRQAEEMLTRALEGFKSVLGPSTPKVHDVARDLQLLRRYLGRTISL